MYSLIAESLTNESLIHHMYILQHVLHYLQSLI